MKRISELALAAVLASGVVGVALVQPAVAQKKKDEKPAGLKLTPAVQKPAGEAQKALAASDLATAETQIAAAEAAAAAGSDDDKYIVAALRFDLERSKLRAAQTANPNAPVNQNTLAKPLEALIANPKTPAASLPQFNYVRGTLAFNERQYPVAIQYLERARQLGYQDPELDVRVATAKMEGNDVRGGLVDLNAAIDRQTAAGQKAPESYYRVGVSRATKAKLNAESLAWLQKWIAAYPSAKNWRDMIITYGFANDGLAKLDTPQKIDLFRLMRASKSLADQYDYMEYAQKTQDRGLPAEALAVLREGTAAGKLPTTNTEVRAMTTEVQKAIAAEGNLGQLETKARSAGDGKLAAQTAEAYLSQGNYAKASDLYRTALQKGGVNADEVNTRLGIALANQGDKAGAKAAFAAVQGATRKDIALLWTTWLDTTA